MKDDHEIITFFRELYGYELDNGSTIEIIKNNKLEVRVAKMYEYVPIDFQYLCKIGTFFNTDKVNLHKESESGCETCDYGSSYEVTFYIG